MFDAGRYRCNVAEQGFGESKTGTPYFFLRVAPVAYRPPGSPEYEHVGGGETRVVYFYLSDANIKNVVRDLRKIGYKHDDFDHLDPESHDHQSFAGEEIECDCEHETYDGRAREKWQIAYDGSSIKPIDPKRKRQLSMLFNKAFRDNSVAVKPAAKPAAMSLKPADNDPIPF